MAKGEVIAIVNSVIGAGAKFAGEVELDGLLRIDGDFVGAIHKADKIEIGKNGRVKSSIKAKNVVIYGAVVGDIIASESIEILSSALVIGNIKAPTVLVENGVILQGLCEVVPASVDKKDTNTLPSSNIFDIDWHADPSKDKE